MPKNTMRVSVIIPAFKSAATICQAIDSALAQSHMPHEIIVVDDGSPDDQAMVVEETYGERVVLIRQKNGGAASARNAGMAKATGEFIAFLDADDYWEPFKLEKQLDVIVKHPEVAVVAGSFFEQVPGKERTQPIWGSSEEMNDRVLHKTGADAFLLATNIWTGVMLFRKSILGSERFESGLEPAEDRDLWFRLVDGNPTYMISQPLATYVVAPGSLSNSSIDRDCKNMLRVIERHEDKIGKVASRVWKSHTLYRWAANDKRPLHAIPRLLKSLILWPMSYSSIRESRRPLVRLTRLVLLTAAVVGLGPLAVHRSEVS